MVAAVMGPPQPPKGTFPGSPPGGAGGLGPTLADQLKNRLEERRRSQEETVATPPSDPLHAEMRQAVKAANEAGTKEKGLIVLWCDLLRLTREIPCGLR